MTSSHVKISKKLREIPLKTQFESILDACTLSEREKYVIRLHYIEKQDFRFIGDSIGYSESTIKSIHRDALRKIAFAL